MGAQTESEFGAFLSSQWGLKPHFCVLKDELLLAEDELFREEGQIIVPNRALPTLEMRPFQLAKMQKNRPTRFKR